MGAVALLLKPRAALRVPERPEVWLCPGEQDRLARQSHPNRRAEYLAGRWLLRELLPGQSPDIDAEGRTVAAHGFANLSHSGPWVAAVACDQPIGIDLEVIRPRRDLLGLAGQVHDELQCAQLAEVLQRQGEAAALRLFYRWWTLKEAWLKARGRGLALETLRRLAFDPLAPDGPGGADSAVAVLDASGVVLALHGPAMSLAALPVRVAGEGVMWELLKSRSLAES